MARDIVDMLEDYQERFIFQGGSDFARKLAQDFRSLRKRVRELEDRLELRAVRFDGRIDEHEILPSSLDGIACRNETISGLQAQVDALTKKLRQARRKTGRHGARSTRCT